METKQFSTEQINEYKQNIIDFVEGRIEPDKFVAYFEANEAILDWLQSMIPEGMTCEEPIEVKLDYFLQKIPDHEYNQINRAHKALCDAKDAPLEEQLQLAKTVVDLLSALDPAIFVKNTLVSSLLYSYSTVLNNPTAYNASYVAEEPGFVRSLFEETYTTVREIPYDVRIAMPVHKYGSILWHYVDLQGWLYRLMETLCPDLHLTKDETLHQKASFMMDVCPDCIASVEVEASGIIEAIIAEVPDTLPIGKRKKQIRQRIKEVFYLTETKSPRWIQSSEWPMSPSGKPMRFVKQVKAKGKLYDECMYTHYIFEDVDTGETKTIDQFT